VLRYRFWGKNYLCQNDAKRYHVLPQESPVSVVDRA